MTFFANRGYHADVAHGRGCNSAPDFNRALRPAYDMSPGDFRAAASVIHSRR
jgi:hypothetical protein